MTLEPPLFRHRRFSLDVGGLELTSQSRCGLGSIEVGWDSEKIQEREDKQIVHFGRVENLPLDLIRPRARWLGAGSVEE